MIELDVFYFHWLSTMTAPLANLRPGMRLIGNVETLALAWHMGCFEVLLTTTLINYAEVWHKQEFNAFCCC